jgi:hypothetical protein
MSSPKGEMVPILLLGGVISIGVGGARTRTTGFLLWTFFELGALALVVERSSWATCLAAIVSKPSKLTPRPKFADKGFEVRKEREVFGGGYLDEVGLIGSLNWSRRSLRWSRRRDELRWRLLKDGFTRIAIALGLICINNISQQQVPRQSSKSGRDRWHLAPVHRILVAQDSLEGKAWFGSSCAVVLRQRTKKFVGWNGAFHACQRPRSWGVAATVRVQQFASQFAVSLARVVPRLPNPISY